MPVRTMLKRPFLLRIAVLAVIFLIMLALLILNLIKIQLVNAEQYRESAFEQYTKETSINPKRGTIYDRNMQVMAISASVEDVCISGFDIAPENEIEIATYLSEKLGKKFEDVLARTKNKDGPGSRQYTVARQVEREVTDEIRAWIAEKGYTKEIFFVENTKRYYPNGSLASHVLGFTGYDGSIENAGLYGIEAKYDSFLRGVPGKIVTARNGVNDVMPFKYESYIGAENGTNVVLTIDKTIQSYLERALESALVDTRAKNRVFGIVMDVNTAEILAMAVLPDYDPNNPGELDEISQAKLDAAEDLSDDEKKELRSTYLSELWKNKAVNELYEPGSTFKLVTSAIALEENKVSKTETFYCGGVLNVAGTPIHCHNTAGHGQETFEQGLQNSCNPVFMLLAARIGKNTFYKYFEDFGFMDKTGIDLPGEASSIYHYNLSDFNDVELATYSFGQTFKITPIQLITAVSAVANGGYLLKPHVVKKLVDDDGNVIESYDTTIVRQIVSKETSDTIMEYLAAGIDVGSTKNAYVKGYRVAAKTGTSQKRDKVNPITGEKDLLIGSCVAFAPADDPQIAILIGIDEPSAGQYYGGVIAAPVVSRVLTDVMPYLNIAPVLSSAEKQTMEIALDDYRGLTVSEAKTKIADKGLNYKVIGDGELVTEQFPRLSTKVSGEGIVILYTGNELPSATVTVPSVVGYTAGEANRLIINRNLNIRMDGTYREGVSGAVAVSQSPEAGEVVNPGTVVTVTFKHLDGTD